MRTIHFFTKPDCTLCDAAWYVVQRVRARSPFDLVRVDINAPGNEQWRDAYADHIPVIHLDGCEVIRHRVDERKLYDMLSDAVK